MLSLFQRIQEVIDRCLIRLSWQTLVALAHQNNVKVLVSLAGGSGGNAFRTIVPDPKLRAKFIKNMVFFADQFTLTG